METDTQTLENMNKFFVEIKAQGFEHSDAIINLINKHKFLPAMQWLNYFADEVDSELANQFYCIAEDLSDLAQRPFES